jgi:hypothetical protein
VANDFSAQIILGGITFNTYADDTTTANQRRFSQPDSRAASPRRPVTLENPTDDGETPVLGLLAPRSITLSGFCRVESATPTADLKVARERLMRALMILPSALATMQVFDPIATQADVYCAATAPKWEVMTCQGRRAVARFQAVLTAPDPRKYSQTSNSLLLGIGIAVPTPTASASPTGGTLSTSNLSYRVTAVSGGGETTASTPATASFAPLSTPGQPSLTLGLSGTLAPGAYGYRVAAVNASGETLASTEAVISVGGSGSVISITVAWAPVAGATGYNVYGRTIAGELKMTPTAIVGTSFVDNGSVTPSGALPSSNTTGTTTGSVTLAWSAISGATGYNVYGRTAGVELKMTPTPISALTFTDTGSVTPSGALPAGGFATTITNGGDYPMRPILTVIGPSTNPMILTIGSRALEIDVALTGSQTLVVDTGANKSVKINGVDRLDLLANNSQWPALAPGANAVTYSGGGTASLGYRDAYG